MSDEQELILRQVDNAIALFNSQHHLILFNSKLAQLWGVSPELLKNHPDIEQVAAMLRKQDIWSELQCDHFKNCVLNPLNQDLYYCLEQTDQISLEISGTTTQKGNRLFILRDITYHRRTQANLNTEVRRLKFLLGLNERLQTLDNIVEIAQFALNYLVQVMDAAFGDVKVIQGEGQQRQAGTLYNQAQGQFIATYGEPAVARLEDRLKQGIPYGQGLLWQVVETGEPIFVEDYGNHPNAVAEFRTEAIGQLGIFPIPGTAGKIIGVLTLESRDLERMQAYPQRDMLDAACRTLGAAIERSQAQAELRQMNVELIQASHLKSEFLTSMSHELRTPLNSILGFSDLLQRQGFGPLNAQQLNSVELVHKSGQHLLDLINDILDLSKIEAGKVDLSLQPVNIHSLCNECLTLIQPRTDKKRLALSLELDYRINQAVLDERRVRQIIINLLSNAVKFTPEGGKVKLGGYLAYGNQLQQDYRPDDSPINLSTPYLCLAVEDSGIGIPRESWPQLFRPFQQVDASLNRRHEGTGLGLALTKRLAELHGGTVSLNSQVNQGSTFKVWLPLTEMRQQLQQLNRQHSSNSAVELTQGATEISDADSQQSYQILVVEDQPINQTLICEVLKLEGYQVELISEGQVLQSRIQSQEINPDALPDLILMDIQLPEIDGLQLMRQLKRHPQWQSIPIIAVTAMAMPGDRDRCLAAGASDYLSKPIDVDQSIQKVKSLLYQSDSNHP
jgi:signal transduction histidine kinase/ActR/RegA family two-component response regulator